ncbi:MAG: hypothetical protein NT003_00140, partial [Candidatus Magasanikbacteria bacterium]|nr:hypothetical protein [Candidatus Magasanikbacteria bacterium]
MSLKSIIAITVGGLFALILFMGGMSWYSTAVSLTNATEAQWRQNQNSYDAFWKQVKEVAQVTEEYKESFRQVLIGTTELRYAKGAGGFAVAEA